MDFFQKETLLFCQVFGGFPLKYTSKPKGNMELRFSPTVAAWGVFVAGFQTVSASRILYLTYRTYITMDEKILNIPVIALAFTMDVSSLIMVSIVVFFSYLRKYPILIRACKTLKLIDLRLQLDGTDVRARVRVFVVFLITTAVGYSSDFIISEDVKTYKSPIDLLVGYWKYFPFINVFMAQAAQFVHFTHVSRHLSRRFRLVNADIVEEVTLTCLTGQEEDQLLGIFNTNQGSRCEKIKYLVNTYWMLCNAARLADDFYNNQLMAILFSSVIHTTISLYYLYLYVGNGNVFRLAVETIWVVSHILHLVLLVGPSTSMTQSANETPITICKLLSEDLEPETKTQLEEFLLQLPHAKATFSAHGCFRIENSMLMTMAGAVMTYLVILVQFQNQTEST